MKSSRHPAKKHIISAKPSFKDFQLHCGTFDYCVNVIISKDLERCAGYVNSKHERPDYYTPADFNCLGKVFFSSSYCPVLWLPTLPVSVSEQGTLIHELLHIVFDTANWAGVTYSSSSEEVYTHLLKYLYKQFYEQLTPSND